MTPRGPLQPSLFEGARLQMTDSIAMTVESLAAYGPQHRHWAVAWSGGKDSTTVVTLLAWLLESGRVPRPETLTVLYADTRMELLPLWLTAQAVADELRERGTDVRTVMAPLDQRFLVYMLGRGVPPPNNMTLRWCTEQIKVKPMAAALEQLAVAKGLGRMVEKSVRGRPRRVYEGHGAEKLLVLTGVRMGESAARDGRIALSCATNGGECGQGWYQRALPTALNDTLAPCLHWRICHVWQWLDGWAPREEFGGFSTQALARAYGGRDGDEAEELGARTGCVGCPLAEVDTALDALIASPSWAYLAPLKRLRPLYRELRLAANRLRKPGGETRKDGTPVRNQHRMGPLKLATRRDALDRILAIQAEVNAAADAERRPRIDLLNAEEVARIHELIDAGTWPNKWRGDEPGAEEPYEDGGQLLLLDALRRRA